MRKTVLYAAMLAAVGLVGCAGPTPTPTPEPTATATPEPTATATPEGLTLAEYKAGAIKELQTMANAGAGAFAKAKTGRWMVEGPDRDALVADLKTVLQVEQRFKNTTPPAGAEEVHGRLLVLTANYANSMGKLAEATDMVAAGDAIGAKSKSDESAALMNAAAATLDEDIAALKALAP